MRSLDKQLLMRAFEHHAAGFEHVAAVARLQRLDRPLLDQQHGQLPVAADLDDALENGVDDGGREAHRRLVQHEQLRRRGEPAADGDHLLLAARQRAGKLLAPLSPARETASGCSRGSGSSRAGRQSVQAPISRFSSTDRLGKTCRPSGTWAMPRCGRSGGVTLARSWPSKMMRPRGRRHGARDGLEQRRLAGAVGADDRDELAVRRP